MIARVSVEIPTPTYIALLKQLRQAGSAANIAEAVGAAVEYWLAEQRRLAPDAPESVRGYQWKSVFLPEGTELRSLSYGQQNSARVEKRPVPCSPPCLHRHLRTAPRFRFPRHPFRNWPSLWRPLSPN